MFMAWYFMLLFDLTPDSAASAGHNLLPYQGNIRVELQFDKTFSEAVTCLLYLENENCLRLDQMRSFRRHLIMDTAQILCTLKDVPSILGVYPSDILPLR